MTSVVYCRIFLHFMSSLINNFKKYNSLPLTGINTFFEKIIIIIFCSQKLN